MPAEKEITVKAVHEVFDRLNFTEPTATTYFPEFRNDIYIVGPGSNEPVNEVYCLTVASAMQLMLILEELGPVGYADPPSEVAGGSPYTYTSDVPWATFNNGAVRNLGLLAQYWRNMHGDPNGKYALQNCLLDIAWG